jgi:hypothetical protein
LGVEFKMTNEKQIITYLHRLLNEKCQETKKIQERISELNHQIENYDKMADVFKQMVLNDAIEDCIFYNGSTEMNWSGFIDFFKIEKNKLDKEAQGK